MLTVVQMISNSDVRNFQRARQVALVSDFPYVHIGCIAVYQAHIIGMGCNTSKTHPRQKYYNRYRNPSYMSNGKCLPKLHAEINCINSIYNLDIQFSKVKLYVHRVGKSQAFRLSRPCPSCMAAIRDLGIRDIFYTTNDRYVYEKSENI